jgi:transposase
MITVSSLYVGIDVSKKYLDIYIYPTGKRLKINNSEDDIQLFIKELKQYQVTQIACESTGGYEKLLVNVLQKSSYDVWIIDPRRIKGFIVASGCKTKTDKIDAQKIAEFASKNIQGYVAIRKTDNEQILQSFINRKADLTRHLSTEKTRLKHPAHELSIRSIKIHINFLKKEIKKIDGQITECVKNDTRLNKKAEALQSIPGIGQSTAALLVAFLPELGQLKNSEISSLVGVCPFNRESGSYSGKRYIHGGRVIPRNALYMCALTSIKYYAPLKKFYDHLIVQQKPFKVAIVAVMHKLIIIANALLKKDELCKA